MTDQPHSDPPTLVDYVWDDAFVVELRLLGVTGDRIGAALAEVEAHCADSGETRQAAFGAPVPYARALDLPRTAVKGPDAVTVAVVLASWTGVVLSFMAWENRRQGYVDVTVGTVAALVVLAALGALLVAFRAPAEDAVVRRPVLVPALTVGLVAGTLVWVAQTFDTVAASPDWRVLAALGTLLLLTGLLHSLRTPPREDPVVAPAGSRDAGRPLTTRADGLLRGATPWAPIVVATLHAVLSVWG